MNKKELEASSTDPMLTMTKDSLTVKQPGGKGKTVLFDRCFSSASRSSVNYASQQTIFDELGGHVLDGAWSGFNCSMFAYGQTGSGKSYTMMGGKGDETGFIPRICTALLEMCQQPGYKLVKELERQRRISRMIEVTAAGEAANRPEGEKEGVCLLQVAYMEIYNEKVKDSPCLKHTHQHPLTARNCR
jgi:hypothetical protein